MTSENEQAYRSVYRRGEAMGYREGVSDELARIIKLLTDFDNEKYYEWLKSDDKNWPDYSEVAIGFRLAIALINGENK